MDDWSFIISLDKISFPAVSFPQHTSVLTHNLLKCCSVHESFFSPEVMTDKNDVASAFIHIYKHLSLVTSTRTAAVDVDADWSEQCFCGVTHRVLHPLCNSVQCQACEEMI